MLDELAATGRLSNTLIVYTTDNGIMLGEHRFSMTKNLPYEEAIRSPFVARWDGVIPAGRTDPRFALNIDLAPTFAAAAGAAPTNQVDGSDLLPLLTGRPTMAGGTTSSSNTGAPTSLPRTAAFARMRASPIETFDSTRRTSMSGISGRAGRTRSSTTWLTTPSRSSTSRPTQTMSQASFSVGPRHIAFRCLRNQRKDGCGMGCTRGRGTGGERLACRFRRSRSHVDRTGA